METSLGCGTVCSRTPSSPYGHIDFSSSGHLISFNKLDDAGRVIG